VYTPLKFVRGKGGEKRKGSSFTTSIVVGNRKKKRGASPTGREGGGTSQKSIEVVFREERGGASITLSLKSGRAKNDVIIFDPKREKAVFRSSGGKKGG